MIRKFFQDSTIYTFSVLASSGLSVILAPLYMQVLSPADYGSLDLLIVFAGIVNFTIALGVSQGLARFFSSEPNPVRKVGYASSAFWFTLACHSIFAIIMQLAAPYVSAVVMGQAGMDLVFRFGVAYVWANSIFYAIQNQLRWELRSGHYAAIGLFMAIITAIVSVLLCFFLKWGLIGIILGMVVGCISADVLGLWWLRKSLRFTFDMKLLQEMLRFSIPLVFSSFAVWMSSYVDRLMINHFLSVNEVGLYGIGYRLASVAGLMTAVFQLALVPLVYTNYQNPDTPRQLGRIFRWFVMLSLLTFLSLSFFSQNIIDLIAPPSFRDAAKVVIYLVPAILLSNMDIFSPGVFIANKTQLVILINVVGGVTNLVLNYLLIPPLGIEGAGLATMVGGLCVFLGYTIIGQRYYYIPHSWLVVMQSVGISVFLVILLSVLDMENSLRFAAHVAAIVFFALASIGIGLIRREEIEAAVRLMRQYVNLP